MQSRRDQTELLEKTTVMSCNSAEGFTIIRRLESPLGLVVVIASQPRQ